MAVWQCGSVAVTGDNWGACVHLFIRRLQRILILCFPGETKEADPAADDHGPAQEAEPAEPLDGDLLSAAHNQSKHHDLCGGAESRLGGGEAALLRASGSLLEQLGIYVVESPDLAREGGREGAG